MTKLYSANKELLQKRDALPHQCHRRNHKFSRKSLEKSPKLQRPNMGRFWFWAIRPLLLWFFLSYIFSFLFFGLLCLLQSSTTSEEYPSSAVQEFVASRVALAAHKVPPGRLAQNHLRPSHFSFWSQSLYKCLHSMGIRGYDFKKCKWCPMSLMVKVGRTSTLMDLSSPGFAKKFHASKRYSLLHASSNVFPDLGLGHFSTSFCTKLFFKRRSSMKSWQSLCKRGAGVYQ